MIASWCQSCTANSWVQHDTGNSSIRFNPSICSRIEISNSDFTEIFLGEDKRTQICERLDRISQSSSTTKMCHCNVSTQNEMFDQLCRKRDLNWKAMEAANENGANWGQLTGSRPRYYDVAVRHQSLGRGPDVGTQMGPLRKWVPPPT